MISFEVQGPQRRGALRLATRTATAIFDTVADAADRAAAEPLLQVRLALPSIERLGRVLIEDIAVPRTRLSDAVTGIDEISLRTGVKIFTFARAGDGNLHPIPPASSTPARRSRILHHSR